MAKFQKLFGSDRVIGVEASSPVDNHRWWPAALLDALTARFGKLLTDEEIEAAWELTDEADRLEAEAISSQEGSYFASYHETCTAD